MSLTINHYRLWRIELPVGRVIGDWMCGYESFKVVALALDTAEGLTGWGYGVRVSNGQFSRPVPWRAEIPSILELRNEFEDKLWNVLRGRSAADASGSLGFTIQCPNLLTTAARGALWDLRAKIAGVPLHQLMGPGKRNSIRAYASHLEFHLSETQIRKLCQRATELGLSAIKVKVGHPIPQRDIDRLRLVQESMPPGTELAIDANTAWTAEQAVDRVTAIIKAGIRLAYVEDPLPLDDVAGYQRLSQHLPIDVVGHDYATNPAQLRPILDVGGLQRLRIHSDLDFAIGVSELANEYDLPIIVGNMLFELGVHAAAAFDRVERIEYSNLDWNDLPQYPVRVERGQMFVPQTAGTGLDPQLDLLDVLSCSPDDEALANTGATAQ